MLMTSNTANTTFTMGTAFVDAMINVFAANFPLVAVILVPAFSPSLEAIFPESFALAAAKALLNALDANFPPSRRV